MSEEKHKNDTGEPKPVDLRCNRLIQAGAVIAILCGGFWASSHLVAPRRLSGATRSAKLRWERAHAEMEQAIQSADRPQAATITRPSQ
jgi:hypothetical protein